MFKHIHNISWQISLKSLLACSLIAISTTQVNAGQGGQSMPLPAPVWNGPIPITWGECIPVPVEPMAMPPLNNSNNNMGMAMPYAPTPMLPGTMPPAPFLVPPPGPFYDVAPAAPMPPLLPLPPVAPAAACNEYEDKLNTLQEHYNLAAEASRKKIAELTETLKDTQNQLQDSVTSLEMMSENKASNQTDTHALANNLASLKQTSETMISMLEKENTELKKQLAALKNRLKASMESSKSQAQQLMLLGSTNKDLDALKKQLADATASNQALKIKLNELLKSSAETIKASETKTEKALLEAKQSKEQLDALKKQFDAMGMQLNGIYAENKKLKTELATLKANAENKNKTIYGLKQSSSQLAQIQQAYQAQQNKTKVLEQQLVQLQALKSELEQYKTNAANLQQQKDAQVATTEALKKQLAELRTANEDIQAQLSKLKEEDKNKNKTIFGLKQSTSQLLALQQAYQASQNKTKTLEQQLAGIEKIKNELASCKAKSDELGKEIAAAKEKNATLKTEIAALKNNSDSQAQKLAGLMAVSAELAQLKEEYKNLGAKNEQLTAELASATADSDKDGVLDKSDKCPFSPEGASVNAQGCVADKDNDGVADNIDQCPESPLGSHVNEQGCPKDQQTAQNDVANKDDTDKDGVPNASDLCPESAAGASVNDFGCTASENITLKGVNFRLGSAKLTPASLPILDAAAETLKKNPNLKIEVAGHTDSQGFAGINKRLSQRRANTVMIYLIRKGVKAENITAKGYGESKPVTNNKTRKNRAKNRRVELKILK